MILAFAKTIKSGKLKGWSTEFVEKVLTGSKKHTIRKRGKRKFRIGMELQLATGVRTKSYKQFAKAYVSDIKRLTVSNWNAFHPQIMDEEIPYNGGYITVEINGWGNYLKKADIEALAKADGFDSLDQFVQWFDLNKGAHIVCDLIYWDKLECYE